MSTLRASQSAEAVEALCIPRQTSIRLVTMRKGYGFSSLLAVLLTGAMLIIPASALAQDQDPTATQPGTAPVDLDAVVARIGDVEIYEYELALAASELDAQYDQLQPAQRRAAALSAIVDIKLMAGLARQSNLQNDTDFKRRMAFLTERALHNAYFRENVLEGVSEADVRARYDAEIAATPPQEEISARHILVETEDRARELIVELQDGKDFAELARQDSTGPSGPQGGDLGYFTRGRMVPEFEAAAFALEVGSFTDEPVQTQFGWHIIKVEDRREVAPPPYEEVAEQMRQVVYRERYIEILDNARNDSPVDIDDPALKAAFEAATAPAPSE